MPVYQIVLTIITAVFASTGFWEWLQHRNKKKSNETKLLMGIAYSMIIDRCESYLDRGWVSTDEYHELYHYLYQPYKNEGGNGTAEMLIEKVGELPNSK